MSLRWQSSTNSPTSIHHYFLALSVLLQDSFCSFEKGKAGLDTVTEKERKASEDMLQSMLTLRLKDRATAEQALHSEWMKGQGELALEELGYV